VAHGGAGGAGPLHPGLGATASATLQEARDQGPTASYHGKKLPHLPDLQTFLELRADLGGTELAYQADYESSLYRDRYNTASKRRGDRWLQSCELRVRALDGAAQVGFAIHNVAGVRTHDVDGFPLPGRSIHFELTLAPAAHHPSPVRPSGPRP
jgi:hypothetical protein